MESALLQNKKLPLWEFVFVILVFALYLLPSVSIGSTILLGILLIYGAYLALVDKDMLVIVGVSLVLVVLLAMFYALLTDASSISQGVADREYKRFISKLYQYWGMYFPAILFIRITKTANETQKKALAIIGIVIMIYVIITTWSFLVENPDATRDWESFEENSTKGVANYYFIYAVPIIISALSIFLFRAKRWAVRLTFLALVVAGILFLVDAQYTLSILIAVIGLMIQIFRNIRSNVGKILFVFAMIVVGMMLPQILDFAIQRIESAQVTERLSEINAFLTGKGAGGYNLNGRLTLYGRTIEAFFQSPFTGNRYLPFDGHATFLTVLSDTGVLGGIPFYSLLFYTYKRIKMYLNVTGKQFNTIFIMFVIMGLTNPIHAAFPLGLVTWFLAPLTIQLIIKEDVPNEKTLEN